MIDTNQVQQIADTAQAVKSQLQPWLPALAVGAAWAGREIANFNAWLISVSGKVIAHGGVARIIGKLIYNKSA